MVFTVNEEKRIICLFAIYESPTEVRRRYINEYYIAPRVASTLQLTQFIRVWKRFQERGGLSKFQGQHRKGTGLPGTDEANASIIRHFDFHPKDSITKAAADLGLSRTTTWRVARAAKMKPYKVLKTHQIKETNFGLRLTFGVWCLSKIETAADFTSRVIFSDEKWWVLDSSPNSQNDRRWSLVNPREYAECKYQSDVLDGFPSRSCSWPVLVRRRTATTNNTEPVFVSEHAGTRPLASPSRTTKLEAHIVYARRSHMSLHGTRTQLAWDKVQRQNYK